MPTISEQINRYKEIMGLLVEQDSELDYRTCDRFEGKSKYACKTLNGLGSWLSRADGMGMQGVIDKSLEQIQLPVPNELLERFNSAIDLLSQTRKYSDSYLNWAKDKIKNAKLVYDDNGEWKFVNKLNTNYSDLSELITEMIIRMGAMDKFYNWIKNNPSKDELKKLLISRMKPGIIDRLNEHFVDKLEYDDFTKNAKVKSREGEIAEEKIEQLLKKNGFQILYKGGNGDLIDMNFGTDIIAERLDYGIVLVQVKKSGPYWDSLGRYKVDFIGIGDDLKIYDKDTQEEIDISQYITQ